MEETFVPFEGIKNDLRGRLMCYKQDWTGGFKAGLRYVYMLNLFSYQWGHVFKDFNVSQFLHPFTGFGRPPHTYSLLRQYRSFHSGNN